MKSPKLTLKLRGALLASGLIHLAHGYALDITATLLMLVARLLRTKLAARLWLAGNAVVNWIDRKNAVEFDLLDHEGNLEGTIRLPRRQWNFMQREAKAKGITWQQYLSDYVVNNAMAISQELDNDKKAVAA